jgi:ABC-type multidrug transport system fused ATPase/permease subunit
MGLEKSKAACMNDGRRTMEQILFFTKRLYSFAGNKLIINILGMVLVSLLDGMGIFLLVPIISTSGMVNFNTRIPFLSELVTILQSLPKSTGLLLMLCLFILLVVGQNFLQRNLTIRDVRIQQSFTRYLRLSIYSALLQAKWEFFTKRRNADLVNLLTTELALVSSGTNLSLQFLSSLIFTIIQVCIAFWLSARLTIFVFIFGLLLTLFSRHFLQKASSLGKQKSQLGLNYLAGITDQLNGMKDIKSNLLEESRLIWMSSLTQKMVQEQIEYTKLRSSSQFLYKSSSAVLIAFFIFFSVNLFDTQPEHLFLIILIFSRLWPRFTGIQSNLEQIASNLPAFKALIELQEACVSAKEHDGDFQKFKNAEPIPLQQGIECCQVYFRYKRNEPHYVLQNINLHVPSNRMTAFVGRSGAGKSTMIDILMGLLQPECGQVIIDGRPLTSERLFSLRRSISYVPQDPFLFNASIRDNLLMMKPDAIDEEIWEALEFAVATEFICKMPQGLDTLIGDRGVRLSGGERQRLVLARAILRKPSILVLDEATSALDTENEAKIQEAIEQLKGRMTIIVIAHRLSTIRNADQVIVLDEGRIVQMGGFSQLAKEKRGVFSHLLGSQTKVGL